MLANLLMSKTLKKKFPFLIPMLILVTSICLQSETVLWLTSRVNSTQMVSGRKILSYPISYQGSSKTSLVPVLFLNRILTTEELAPSQENWFKSSNILLDWNKEVLTSGAGGELLWPRAI